MDADALAQINAEVQDDVFLFLVTINHADLDEPLRFVWNTEPITSRGNPYIPLRMEVDPPEQLEDRPPRAALRLGDVDRVILAELRAMLDPPTVTIELILASKPNVVQAQLRNAIMREVQYDALWLEAELVAHDRLGVAVPAYTFTPHFAPGLHPGFVVQQAA